MPRRAKVTKRETLPDPKFNSLLASKFINKLMMRGQKRTAERLLYNAMDIIQKQVKSDPLATLEQAVKKATPLLQVKPRRVGGATYQVPVEVKADRALALALRWLLASSRARQGKTMAEKLAAELMDAAQGQGATIKKRDDTHKMAEANKAFAHYRW